MMTRERYDSIKAGTSDEPPPYDLPDKPSRVDVGDIVHLVEILGLPRGEVRRLRDKGLYTVMDLIPYKGFWRVILSGEIERYVIDDSDVVESKAKTLTGERRA